MFAQGCGFNHLCLQQGLQSAFCAHYWLVVASLEVLHRLKLGLVELLVLLKVEFIEHVVERCDFRVHVTVQVFRMLLVVKSV
jgi:hypothetical protein